MSSLGRRRYCVFGCAELGAYMHSFPHPERRTEMFNKWVSIVGRKLKEKNPMKIYKNKKICDHHFTWDHKVASHRLNVSAVPTIHLNGVMVSPNISIQLEHNYCITGISADPINEADPNYEAEPFDEVDPLALDSWVEDREMASLGKRVLVVNKTYPQAGLDLFRQNGFQTTVVPRIEEDPDFAVQVKNFAKADKYDGIVWNTKLKLNAEILDLVGPQLKAVSSMSSGLDQFDLAELEKRGVPIGNTPKALTNTVAELTVGLMIAAARKFKDGIQIVERGEWKFGVQWNLGQDVADSTVGIVGLGMIGQAVVKRLKAFDVARFLYTGRHDKPEAKDLGVERVPLEKLLKDSDFVILSCPLTDETRNMIDARALDMMKTSAVLINIGRGGVVDTQALYEALKEKKIFAAGLDVIEPEPINRDHPIIDLPNCFLIPHYGSATIQTRNRMAKLAANNIISALQGKPMPSPVTS